MVQLTRIYTRGGDKGKTSLGCGKRVLKSDLLIEAIGAIDEANAAIGCALFATQDPSIREDLLHIQHDLFDVGADLCMSQSVNAETHPNQKPQLKMTPKQVKWLEDKIDSYNQNLKPLTSFILPGGTAGGAQLHMARAIVRRAERELVAIQSETTYQLNPNLIQYINRLSDYLFVAIRVENKGQDSLWEPGKNQI